MTALADRVLAGDPRALARAISLVEGDQALASQLLRSLFHRSGRAHLVGVTGPPGAGKSTLVDRLTTSWRRAGRTVGILAVDPSSPFTGGALLGDRVRMQSHANDPGVFIRSMATRGRLGGLAGATADAAVLLDVAGKDVVLIETVGVGQGEVDIVRTADVSIVVLVPGSGDEVQALKAGVMEIADIFVVNKADREGAARLVTAVESVLSLQALAPGAWQPPVLQTVATSGAGLDALTAAVARFRDQAEPSREPRRADRVEARIRDILDHRFHQRLRDELGQEAMSAIVRQVVAGEIDPYAAAERIMGRMMPGGSERS